MQSLKEALDQRVPTQTVPTVSAVFKDGSILEMLYDPDAHRTRFAFWKDGAWTLEENHQANPVQLLVPYSPNNNLISNGVVLLPSGPQEYGSEEQLLTAVQSFIHRYVDVTPLYEQIATYYVLLSWVYDNFNELPYLRVRGDPGTGKTRFLLTIGSLCYKPIFGNGAASSSPLFRLLETFRGTLVIDESDIRFSDEKADIVKILNSGNVRGIPVLRSEVNSRGEYNPRAYQVFGPKIVATRGDFEDRALESRFLTEDMGGAHLRDDVPINLPAEHKAEALALRNKLLLFRFRNFTREADLAGLVDRSIEPRLNQIFVPLLSIIENVNARERLRAVAKQYQQEVIIERGQDREAQVLEVIQDLLALPGMELSVKEITSRFIDLYGEEGDRKMTPKWMGSILRKRLRLKTQRTRTGYVIQASEHSRLEQLFAKYGLSEASAPER